LVKDNDVKAAASLPEVDGTDSDFEMEEGWDRLE